MLPPHYRALVHVSAALARVMEDGEVRRRLVELQADPAGSSPEQMAQAIRQETERWTPVIRDARIRID